MFAIGWGCHILKVSPLRCASMLQVLGDDPDSEIGLIFMRNNKTLLVFEGSPSYTTFSP